jgi:hypothetical protein
MDEPRKSLGSSGPATFRKGETHDWDHKMIITIVWNSQSFHLVNALLKARNLMQIIISAESYNYFWRVAQLGVAQVSSFMRTMRDLISLEKLSIFARKIA